LPILQLANEVINPNKQENKMLIFLSIAIVVNTTNTIMDNIKHCFKEFEWN
jgi:hypothetical protein